MKNQRQKRERYPVDEGSVGKQKETEEPTSGLGCKSQRLKGLKAQVAAVAKIKGKTKIIEKDPLSQDEEGSQDLMLRIGQKLEEHEEAESIATQRTGTTTIPGAFAQPGMDNSAQEADTPNHEIHRSIRSEEIIFERQPKIPDDNEATNATPTRDNTDGYSRDILVVATLVEEGSPGRAVEPTRIF